MLADEIRQHIIRPCLQVTNLWTPATEILIYGTGYVESNYDALIQTGSPVNGGLGFWQDEPSDFRDAAQWLRNGFNKDILERVLSACYFVSIPLDPLVLISNIKFACLICRIHYYRVKVDIPDAKDASGMAAYHVKYYNSGGKANLAKNTITFQKIIDGDI